MLQEEKYLGNMLNEVLDMCLAPILHIEHPVLAHRIVLNMNLFYWFRSVLPAPKLMEEHFHFLNSSKCSLTVK